MTNANPYAPPQAEAGFGKVEAVPESYWIENDSLFVKDHAILPDICLKTGAVEGILTRRRQTFQHHPPWALNFYRFSFILLWLSRFNPFVFLLPISLAITIFFLKKKIVIAYCLSKPSEIIVRRAAVVNLIILIGSIIAYIILQDIYRFSSTYILAPITIGLLSIFSSRRISKVLTIKRIDKDAAQLTGIHPEALRQLTRWHKAHLKTTPG